MAGTKGHSGGHNRISAETHVLKGTYRPSRHAAALAAATAPIPFPAPAPSPPIPASLLTGLGVEAQTFVTEIWADLAFPNAADRLWLRMTADEIDRRSEARAVLVGQPKLVKAPNGTPILHPMVRLEQRATRNLIDLLKRFDVTP